jgi:RND superfamily putative drug exporter
VSPGLAVQGGALTDQSSNVSASIPKLDELQPKLLALIPQQIQNPAAE